jgi:hypothetical protein
VNVSLVGGEVYRTPLRDVGSLPEAVSDDAVIQLVGGAFARVPLDVGDARDIRLVAFMLDVSSRFPRTDVQKVKAAKETIVIADNRLGPIVGLSSQRIERAISRLLEARVLEHRTDDPPRWFRFSGEVIQAAGSDQYVDWSAVIGKIAGRGPALLLLRAVLDLIVVPWEWTRLTYDQLASRAAYSTGMAQRGVAQLLERGILERADHSGRGHDYRLTAWALGRGPLVISDEVFSPSISPENAGREKLSVAASVKPSSAKETGISTMAVEIGGLVLRIPVGTEICMTVGADGEMQYQVGSELRITPRK